MNDASLAIATLDPPERLSMWDWVCREVDFSRDPRYRAAWPGRYNPDLMPYFREMVENFDNPQVREMVLLKPSQAGGSEHTILMPLRYAVARMSICALYVSAQQETTEQFFIERIARGIPLTKEGERAWNNRKERGYVVDVGNCQLVHTWAKSGTGIKQRPVDWCFGDELSTWPDIGIIDELRKRSATRPNPKLVLIGTPDVKQKRSSDDDPIFIEFKSTDQREWMMQSPAGNRFKWEFGGTNTPHGVKWDQSAKIGDDWDLDRVKATAHYVTPDGHKILDEHRRAATATGEWQPQAKGILNRRGYHMNQFLLPFEFGSFGHIAVNFLESKKKGAASLRAFNYEVLAEGWADSIERPRDDALGLREMPYDRGDKLSDEITFPKDKDRVIVTVDVQKYSIWWTARAWWPGGHSCLVDWGNLVLWEDLEKRLKAYRALSVLVDNTYPKRRMEVFVESLHRTFIPCDSKSSLEALPYKKVWIDPYEGTEHQSKKNRIAQIVWNSSTFKPLLMDMINGQSQYKWHIYKGIERDYVRQVMSEELTPKGWQVRRGYIDNHLWDCEALQVLGATIAGYITGPMGVHLEEKENGV